MARYKIVIAYDGTDYGGWQFQPDNSSIVGALRTSFKRAFYQDVSLVGASRTDAGVHALGQVASFSTDLIIDPLVLRQVWQRQLPAAILLRSLQIVDDSFHPQRHVQQKTYYYHIFLEQPLPMVARYGWYYSFPTDIDKLRAALDFFVGTHDFRSFCTGYERENTVRTIDAIDLTYIPLLRAYRIRVQGPSFLRYMIRRIVGAAMLVATSSRSITVLREALHQKDPQQQLLTAPPHGLLLRKVFYKN